MSQTVTDRGAQVPRRRRVEELHYARAGDNEKVVTLPREAMQDGKDALDGHSAGTMIRKGTQVYAIKGSAEKGDFSLVFRGESDDPLARRELERTRDRYFRPSCFAPDFNLPDLLDKPELSIRSVKPETRDGVTLIRVDYTFVPKDPKRPSQRAWCLFDPDQGWALREFESTYETPNRSYTRSSTVTYGPGPEFKPISLRQRYLLPGSVEVTDFVYDRFDFGECPAGTFALEPFGLGDLESPPANRNNDLPYWFGGVAALAFILSVGLRVLSRRWTRTSPAA